MTVISAAVSILVLAATLAVCGVLAAAGTAVRSLPRGRARRLAESGVKGGAAFERLADRPSHLAAAHAGASLLGIAGTSAAFTWAIVTIWTLVPLWLDPPLAAIVAFVLVFSAGEALPRAVALSNPEGVALASGMWAGRLTRVLYPVARVLSLPWTRLVSLVSGERTSDVPWAEPAEEHRFGILDDEQAQHEGEEEDIIEAVSDLHTKIVREVMVPRTDMVVLEDVATVADALGTITEAGVSRVPVFHGTVDDIRGVLYAKDLLAHIGNGEAVLPADIARPAYFVPETKPIEELLREMRLRTHIAIVADEYGGTAGLVTIEDLLEEIVGEIFDEYDPQVTMVSEAGDGRFHIDARLAVDELDERFGTALDVDADTAGGLFTEVAGHIPKVGESIEVQGILLTVEAMEGNRVRQLIVEPVERRSEETNDD
jgi:CBS domain containing-hemolysin-like protein